MTTIETIITCDECGEAYCNGDLRNETAAQQREGFLKNGWHRSKGLDVCPRCWKAREKCKSNDNSPSTGEKGTP